MVRSTLKTFQGLTIGGINMRDRTMQPSKNVNGQTPKQGEKRPFNETPQNTPRVNDHEVRIERCLGKISRKTRPLSRREHIQATQRYPGVWSEFTRRDWVRSIYTKLMIIRKHKMNRTMDTNPISHNTIITTMRIT